MRRLSLPAVALLIALAQFAAARADDSLSTAYAAILNGDYSTGRSTLMKLRETGGQSSWVDELNKWIDSFESATASRDEVRQKICDWNVEHSKQALTDGKIYLALSYAVQASSYSADEKAFARQDWVQDLHALARGGRGLRQP